MTSAVRGDVRGGTRLTPLFGPAVGPEIISGHVVEGDERVLLLAGSTLVTIDLQRRTQRSNVLRLPPREDCWGLAKLSDGTLWTLMGWSTAAQLSAAGTIERTIELPVAHLGLFGAGDRLVYQQARLPAGRPALLAGRPGETSRSPWSDLTTRAFDDLAMGAAAALNLVGCGVGRAGEIPCWFPDEPVVSLIAEDGTTRRLALAGLARVAPETLINATSPPRAIRDVYVEGDGTMWVMSSGRGPVGGLSGPGGWILAQYSRRGEAIDLRLLPEPARLILRAERGRALVLTGSGMVAEVEP